ncbi:hypothetical protein ACQPZF_11770 [Actinosynnema sp. CS-041913]|uniref:hypothetical protein n=1 Tax=Actinosynnema sp. CS-041913 TaxID=3239917 RepID=UPI003D8BAB23
MFDQGKSFEDVVLDMLGAVDDALAAVDRLKRDLRRLRKRAAEGDVRALRVRDEPLADAANVLADPLARLDALLAADFEAHLASAAYLRELSDAATAAGLAPVEEDGLLMCPPSVVRVHAGKTVLQVGRRQETRLRPSVVAEAISRAHRTDQRYRPESFLRSLLDAYGLITTQRGAATGTVVRLVDLWSVLTLLPGQRAAYPKQDFAQDLYRLDHSEVVRPKGSNVELRWSASSGTKQAGVLTAVIPGGGRRHYWGISFSTVE